MTEEALSVLNLFGKKADSVRTVKYKKNKAVWKIKNDEGIYYLKKTPTDESLLCFVLAAWKHLLDSGVGIPTPLPAPAGESYVKTNSGSYILMTGVAGRKPDTRTIEGKCSYIRILAQFHQASKSFQPPPGCDVYSQIGSLPGRYGYALRKLQAFQEEAKRKNSRFNAIFLKHVSHFIKSIEHARKLLAESSYEALCRERARWVLAHQDFAPSNVKCAVDGRFSVIDADELTFDLPHHDLRIVLDKFMRQRDTWDAEVILTMIKSYHAVNPLDTEELKILQADLMFPDLFCKFAAKYFLREVNWSEEKHLKRMEKALRSETIKEDFLLRNFAKIIRRLPAPEVMCEFRQS